jgi:hypothetical protein
MLVGLPRDRPAPRDGIATRRRMRQRRDMAEKRPLHARRPKARQPVPTRDPRGEHKCTACGTIFEWEPDLRKHELARHAPSRDPENKSAGLVRAIKRSG